MRRAWLIVAFTIAGCSEDGSANHRASPVVADATSTDAPADLSLDSSVEACPPALPPSYTGSPSDAAPPDAGETPRIACVPRDAESCDDPVCDLPPSRCVDSSWLVYFVDGRCVDGYCAWTQKFLHCQTGCMGGGCQSPGTL